jgi:DNA-binding NarL/FixJ family response regulator
MEKIVEAIQQVMRGRIYLSSAMADQVLNRVARGDEEPVQSPVQSLSDRELEVFQQIGRGLTTRQIAEKLHLSPKTIETHREHIKTKLNVSNNNQLVRYAAQWMIEQA